jgi:ABC-type sugar transport system substrate-binding protein
MESALSRLQTPPDVITDTKDDIVLEAVEALRGRDLVGRVKVIGFDALPEALGQVRDRNATGIIEQSRSAQGSRAVELFLA